MKNRDLMDLEAWRAADRRGELWMFVDQHWDANAPDGLSPEEWARHIAARKKAKQGIDVQLHELSTPASGGSA